MNRTSACGWRRRCNHGTREGTAAARPWREEGYPRRYRWLYDRAVISLAEWVQAADSPRHARTNKFVFSLPDTHWRPGLYGLATSYPFLAMGRDITAHKGNAPGPDGLDYYILFQGPGGEAELQRLKGELRSDTYRPGGLRPTGIRQGDKVRTLHIPNVRDRVVERAVTLALQVVNEFRFHPSSFGFRPRRSTSHALGELERVIRETGRGWLGKADVKDAFDSVPHQKLLDMTQHDLSETRLTNLIGRFVQRKGWTNKVGKANVGLPQGGPLSPTLFNIYMDKYLDQRLASQYPGVCYIRWADDILLVCENNAQLEEHQRAVRRCLRDAGMDLNEKKSCGPEAKADMTRGESLEYLGFRISMQESIGIRLDLTEECIGNLWNQLFLDIAEQQPNVTWQGRKEYARKQVMYTVTSWLGAYAGAIRPEEWPTIRGKAIKGWIMEKLPGLLKQVPGPVSHLPVESPTTGELDRLYRRARKGWDDRYYSPIPTAAGIFPTRRDAHANTEDRSYIPVDLTDGADFFPPPPAYVASHCDTNPGPDGVEWNVEI